MKSFLILLVLVAVRSAGVAQIVLDNSSFEGEPQDATTPMGWQPCEAGTTPDILPGFWGVKEEPYEGNSYLGLITRENGTWESIGQRTSSTILKDGCYQFTLMLAHSKDYAMYNKPIKLRIWGGVTACAKHQLLGESNFINHTNWKKYEFKFRAETDINYIIFEAHYMDGIYFFYKGNILIDDCSVIEQCDRA
jgi:Carbohydrate binding domain